MLRVRAAPVRPSRSRASGAGPDGVARGLVALVLAAGLAALDAAGYGLAARFDDWAFDGQAAWLRDMRARRDAAATGPGIVVVGIDEPGLAAQRLPLALIHGRLGAALEAIAAARPRAIGVDIALPDQGYEALLPGADRALLRGLEAARAAAPLVVAVDVDAAGRLRVPYAPLLAAAGGPGAFGLPLFALDCDGRVRRFDPDPGHLRDGWPAACYDGGALWRPPRSASDPAPPVPTFAALLARAVDPASAVLRAGYIDFTRGPRFDVVPLEDVVAWSRQPDAARLHTTFGGRVVLIGSLLPYLDRLSLPVALPGGTAPPGPAPGVVANAQLLRCLLGAGPLPLLPRSLCWCTLLAMAALALPARPALRGGALPAAVTGVLALSFVAHAGGAIWPVGSAVLAALLAVALRTAFDLAAARAERRRLAEALGGYLSAPLLDALLRGAAPAAGARRPLALLFADLRGFTARSEASDPALVREMLNHYYAAITPVLHAHGGTIDNFRGDGIMVMFGAPEELASPCDAALAAAAAVLERTANLNAQALAPRGIDAVAVNIGLAYGDVVYGELGSRDRRDFTALGDAVNVAARLQGVAKRVDFPVVMTAAFGHCLRRPPPGLQDLGVQPIEGHTPVAVLGWRPGGGAAITAFG